MSRSKKLSKEAGENIKEYRHKNVSRLNIPPAGLVARGKIEKKKKIKYAYNPHLAPRLQFDDSGRTDQILKIMEEVGQRKLEPEEHSILREAFRNHEPWLEWAGKKELQWCVVDPVALHIHERLSTQAILRVAQRQDIQRDLFADPEQDYHEAVQFYKHSVDWTNRMILGDSLMVMASLSRREAMAGKVQMIYMDPPYGIKYASNFQAEVNKRDVKDKDEDLTREPEMVKAYRDTWTLGVHSYLSYLRDRLLLCKELLTDTGSIFVQIGDENLHRVRSLMDEVFEPSNSCGIISFVKTGGIKRTLLANRTDYILWYAKDIKRVKYRQLYFDKDPELGTAATYTWVELPNGMRRGLSRQEKENSSLIPKDARLYRAGNITTQGNPSFEFTYQGKIYKQPWKTNPEGLERFAKAERLHKAKNSLSQVNYLDDFRVSEVTKLWTDTFLGSFAEPKVFVVQTSQKTIERCILMTTDAGDLVLDPTCGSGTTAYAAEQWGRRWIMIDVSRVALAIARQRLLTSKYEYYKLRPTSAEDVQRNPDGQWLSDPLEQIQGTCTFDLKTVPHITLKSIAQNLALEPIFEKWEQTLTEKLKALNEALKKNVTEELSQLLLSKLQAKQKKEGKKSVTEADLRRWQLPDQEWEAWEVPFESDPDWPEPLKKALLDYHQTKQQKMDEINTCIAARADQEELVDKAYTVPNVVRVSGPYTLEGVMPAEESIEYESEESPIGGAPEKLQTFEEEEDSIQTEAKNVEAYLDRMIRLLREDGVRFPDNKVIKFTSLEALAEGSVLHAKGTWGEGKEERQIAVIVGPQYGPLSAPMVEDGVRIGSRHGYDDLIFAAFSFDGAAQAAIQDDPDPKVRIHMTQIRPDINMGDLLKTTVSSQLFTVSGSPRTKVKQQADGQWIVEMEGVDIYDPVTNMVRSTGAEKVAAWFLDGDYDGRCFCVTQAFFPDEKAWKKLERALGSLLNDEAFEKLSGTSSLPFLAGEHNRIAVKVIDPRGNEVLRVHRLGRKK